MLTVTVPAGATYQPISVLDSITGLTAYSAQPFIVTFGCGGSTFDSISFAPKVDSTTGTFPVDVSIGDFDGDGKPDLAVPNYNSNTVSVFKNTSAIGTISFLSKVDYATVNQPAGTAIGDMDGDGKPDLAVTNTNNGSVSIFKNTSTPGTISFLPKVDYSAGTSCAHGVYLGDFDGDGKPDLVVMHTTCPFGGTFAVFKNTSTIGNISFSPKVDYTAGARCETAAIGDLDGDGKPDLAVVNLSSNTVSVFRNTSTVGNISFAAKVDYASNSPTDIAIGDLDGDGKPDLAVTNGASSTISVLKNTSTIGTISFSPEFDYTTGSNPRGNSIGDLDGDGKPDLALANMNSNTVSLLRNQVSSGVFSVTTTTANTTCSGSSDGTATVSVTGGTTPYTYLWSTTDTTDSISGLTAGTYYITVTDSSGCTASDSVTITEPTLITGSANISICNGDSALLEGSYQNTAGTYYDTLPASNGCDSILITTLTVNPNLAISLSPTDDAGGCSGTAAATVTAGTPPFTYSWNDPASQTSATATGLCAGSYTVGVTDSAGCSASGTTAVVSSGCNLSVTINTSDASCGSNDGSASASASGGTAPYFYQWTSGDITSNADSLAAGIYILTVTDSIGCMATGVATISNGSGPSVTVNAVANVTCFGASDGAIILTVSGGASPYTYNWSSGDTIEDPINLQAGPYELEVEDAAGCITTTSISVNAPNPITLATTSVDAACGNTDGSVSVTANGGTMPYTYNWSTGGATSSLSSLGAGTYGVTITDANGCTGSAFAAVSETGAATITIDSVIKAPCSGSGAIYITVSGGAAPYTYAWSDGGNGLGLVAGFYDVSVTDSSGCVAVASVEVEPEPLGIQEICLVTVDSITNENVVVWEKPITTLVSQYNIYKEGSQADNYTLVGSVPYNSLSAFTDPNSNSMQRAYRYKISAVDQCGNESDFSPVHKTMHLTINQGIGNNYNLIWDHYEGFVYPSYIIQRYHPSYGWANLATIPSNLFTWTDFNVPQGYINYNVEVVHPNGCTADKAKNFNSSKSNSTSVASVSGPITLTVSSTNVSIGNCDGTATVTPGGGMLPFTYLWDDPNVQTNATATGLCEGTYTVAVIDANGNFAQGSVLVIGDVVGIQSISIHYKVKVAPNPFNQSTVIEFTNDGQENLHLMIFDITGKLVREYRNLSSNKVIVQRKDLGAGTYYYNLKGEKGMDIGKLVTHVTQR